MRFIFANSGYVRGEKIFCDITASATNLTDRLRKMWREGQKIPFNKKEA